MILWKNILQFLVIIVAKVDMVINADRPVFLPWTSSSSSSVRSMTEPFGRVAGVAALMGVGPAAWLSIKKIIKKMREYLELSLVYYNCAPLFTKSW